MDLPEPVLQFPVSVTYSHQARGPTPSWRTQSKVNDGLDKGLISFVDGKMIFQGLRSNFSVHNDHVSLKYRGHDIRGEDKGPDSPIPNVYRFQWDQETLQGEIEINVFSRVQDRKDLWQAFYDEYKLWATPSKRPPTEDIFPPLGPDPDYLIRVRKKYRQADVASHCLFALAVFLLLFGVILFLPLYPGAFAALSWVMGYAYTSSLKRCLEVMESAKREEEQYEAVQRRALASSLRATPMFVPGNEPVHSSIGVAE